MKFNKMIAVCLLLTMAGCDLEKGGESQKAEMALTEANQQRLAKAVPAPMLETSQERIQLVRRLERFNTDDKVSYIYLISFGKVMAFYPIKGKVSSVNSLLTTPEQLIRSGMESGWAVTLASPDLDGSYGSNGDAIFFFTTDDTYVEWNGEYILCDKPLSITTPPELVIQLQGDKRNDIKMSLLLYLFHLVVHPFLRDKG